jgi:hypothetical protein
MINQITGTVLTNSATLETLQQNISQNLPDINSLVLIKVLDKIGSNYKILINGNLFQSRLPLNLKTGDETIARVLSQKPFSLTINDLLRGQSRSTENLGLLLTLLGFDSDEKSTNFIRGLVTTKQPLKQTKIKKVMEFVEKMNLRMDDLLNELLVKIYSADDDYLDYIIENQSNIFRYSLVEIMNNIFNSVKKLNSEHSHQSITLYVNNYLVRNSLSVVDNPYFGSFTEEKFLELISYIEYELKNESYANSLNQILNELKKNLLYLIIQTSVYNYFGLYPSFLILKRTDELILIEYNSFKERTIKNYDVFRFGLKVPTTNLDEVILKGFLSKELLYTNLYLKQNNPEFDEELIRTSEEFHFKFDLNAYIGINDLTANDKPSIWNSTVLTNTY